MHHANFNAFNLDHSPPSDERWIFSFFLFLRIFCIKTQFEIITSLKHKINHLCHLGASSSWDNLRQSISCSLKTKRSDEYKEVTSIGFVHSSPTQTFCKKSNDSVRPLQLIWSEILRIRNRVLTALLLTNECTVRLRLSRSQTIPLHTNRKFEACSIFRRFIPFACCVGRGNSAIHGVVFKLK